MDTNSNDPTVNHHPELNRFDMVISNHTAVLNYTLQGNTIIFTHTGVPTELEGRGLGSRLVKAGLEYARDNNFKVVPACWFVAGYIERHPEYQELLTAGHALSVTYTIS
jgi:hypothetical protein